MMTEKWQRPFIQTLQDFTHRIWLLRNTLARLDWFLSNLAPLYTELAKSSPDLALKVGSFDGASTFNRARSAPFAEMFLCRGVDEFHAVLVDFIAASFEADKKTLLADLSAAESARLLAVGDVIEASSIEELRYLVVSRRLNQLGRFDRVIKLIRAMGVKMVLSKQQKDAIDRGRKLRNLIVHNRSRADATYVARWPSSGLKVGDFILLKPDETAKLLDGILAATESIHSALSARFPSASPMRPRRN